MIAELLCAAISISGLDLVTQNLKGEARKFPADISPSRAIIVVTFSKSASNQALEWTRKLRENQQKLTAGIYQISFLEDVPVLFRSFVISAIRRAVPRDLHENFWIATSSSKEWQQRTGSESVEEAHVLLIENRTQIAWRFHGAFSDAVLEGVTASRGKK